MKSKRRKILKWVFLTGLVLVVIGVSVGLFLWFMPHRDVKNTPADFMVQSNVLVEEYLKNNSAANNKYLAEDGDSKIFEVTGIVSELFKNQNQERVILLKGGTEELGVECTFIKGENISGIKVGNEITIKGAIERGASYDEDLELGEDVLMGKCSLVE